MDAGAAKVVEEQTEEVRLNKAKRLAIACVIAPHLRENANAAAGRKVTIVDKEGNVTGYTTLAKVQEKILERAKIELEVQPDERPKHFFCEKCGRPETLSASGPPPKCCERCYYGNCLDCGETLSRKSKSTKRVRCVSCAAKDRGLRRRKLNHCDTCKKLLNGPPSRGIKQCRACYLSSHKFELTVRKLTESALRRRKDVPKCTDCRKPVSRNAASHSVAKDRSGKPVRCRSCAAKARYANR